MGLGYECCMGMWLAVAVRMCLRLADDVKIERLNYRRLSRVVQRCVQETVLLYCHLLRNKAHVSFAFKNIGVMTYEDDFLCMRFLSSCITTLESNASLTALLHTVSLRRF